MHEISYSGYRPEVFGFLHHVRTRRETADKLPFKSWAAVYKYNVDEITECLGFERAVSGQRQKILILTQIIDNRGVL